MADESATLTLRLDDEMSPGLRRVSDQFDELQRKLQQAGQQGLAPLTQHAQNITKHFSEAERAASRFGHSMNSALLGTARVAGQAAGAMTGLEKEVGTAAVSVTRFAFGLGGMVSGIGLGVTAIGTLIYGISKAAEAMSQAYLRQRNFREQLGEANETNIEIVRGAGRAVGQTQEQVDQFMKNMADRFHGLSRGEWSSFRRELQEHGERGFAMADKYEGMLKSGKSFYEFLKEFMRDQSKMSANWKREMADSLHVDVAVINHLSEQIERQEKLRNRPEIVAAREATIKAQKGLNEAVEKWNEAWIKFEPIWLKIETAVTRGLTAILNQFRQFSSFKTPKTTEDWLELLLGQPGGGNIMRPEPGVPFLGKPGQGGIIGNWFQRGFHNQPMGGAAGESNPMLLPPGAPQPGGGAAAEAREPLLRPWRQGDPSRGTYVEKGVTKQFPILSAAATPLPPLPGQNVLTGVSQGRGVASWFGQGQGWGDPASMDRPGSNALRVPERLQGISLSSEPTLGQFFYVRDPNTGLTYVRQQTDVGLGARTQKIIDISVAAAQREGYTKKSFEAMQARVERGELAPWEVTPMGFGTGRSTAPARSGTMPTVETQNISQEGARTDLPSGMDVEFNPFQESGGPRQSTLDLKPGGGSFGGGGAQAQFFEIVQTTEQRLENEKWYRAAANIPTRKLTRPESTNIEDRRRIDLSGDPGGLEGTGSMGQPDLSDVDLPGSGRMPRRRPITARGRPGLSTQLGLGDVPEPDLPMREFDPGAMRSSPVDRAAIDRSISHLNSSIVDTDATMSTKLNVNFNNVPADVKVSAGGDGFDDIAVKRSMQPARQQESAGAE